MLAATHTYTDIYQTFATFIGQRPVHVRLVVFTRLIIMLINKLIFTF